MLSRPSRSRVRRAWLGLGLEFRFWLALGLGLGLGLGLALGPVAQPGEARLGPPLHGLLERAEGVDGRAVHREHEVALLPRVRVRPSCPGLGFGPPAQG